MSDSRAISRPRLPNATPRVVVVGAGIGGLVAALTLSGQGAAVTLVERAATPGGKLRQLMIDGAGIDCGPTVLTLRDVFETVFAEAGTSLDAHLDIRPASILARHAWAAGGRLDLHAEVDASADAIARFAGPAEARGYRAFAAQAKRTFDVLDRPFIHADKPSMARLLAATAPGLELRHITPFSTLWRALGRHFRDERLRQLFGRYATYCGSSPFRCPATLMLVAHVEQSGVWFVDGGMRRIGTVLADLAARHGACLRYDANVRAITTDAGQVTGVEIDTGERLAADVVVFNGDIAALGAGLLGDAARHAATAPSPANRSLSALTFAMKAPTTGFPLARHNVFFSHDYPAEFVDLTRHRRLPRAPTVYVCAQDRESGAAVPAAERLFCIVNAPATGDTDRPDTSEIAQCQAMTFQLLERCGLMIDPSGHPFQVTSPQDFARMFPATGGALYGAASHGWTASFRRPGVRSRLPGLYLCGGSTHPGPGLPMAALSGRMAALASLADWASTHRSHRTATPGGMSTD